MSPEQLGQYVDVLRAKGVSAFNLEFEGVKLAISMGPDPTEMVRDPSAPPATFTEPEPGGWKGPRGLDESQMDEEAP